MSNRHDLSFGAQLESWARETQERATAIFRASAQEVVSRCQARIPIDTGFARASIQASLSQMPKVSPGKAGERNVTYPDTTPAVVLTIAGADLGDTFYVGWTAAYVVMLEYGHSMQAPLGFVGITAEEWPGIVREVTAQLGNRLGRSA